MAEDFLEPSRRAEDILLGSVGIDGDARIISIERVSEGYRGIASWGDGETVSFESDHDLSSLEIWALQVLCDEKRHTGT